MTASVQAPSVTGAARAPRSAKPSSPARRSSVVLAIAAVALIGANIAGASYYSLPISERVRSSEHAWLRPSGYIGQSAGILAALIFAFLWLYPLRKKYRALSWMGAVSKWLDVHIAFALLLPLLLAVHAAWRFGGIIGLGFDAMMIVWASGIVGRYLYARIPRSRSGLELTLEEISADRKSLVTELAARTGLDPATLETTLGSRVRAEAPRGLVGSLFAMIAGDFSRWRLARELKRRWRRMPGRPPLDDRTLQEAVDLATREIALDQQVRFLQRTHRIFRYWHVLHRPIALTALVAVIIHIAVVVSVGATWFW